MLQRPQLSHYLVRMLASFRSILCLKPLFWLFLCALTACSYRLGRPPVEQGFQIGAVVAPVVQPEIADELTAALAGALRRLDVTGEQVLDARVTRADWAPAAARGGSVASWEATLEVRYVMQATDRVFESRRSTIVTAEGADPGALDVMRSDTFRTLASASADEAVAWFAFAPEER